MKIMATTSIIVAAVASLLVQSTNATTDLNTETAEEQVSETIRTNTNTNNNISNAVLGSLFLSGDDTLTNFKPINKTYTELSYAGNRTIFPPNVTSIINGTETGNLTFNLKPNGISLVEGQSLLVTKSSDNNGPKQESATALLVDLNGIRPNDPRSSTGVAYFSTNSTGQLAFLNNTVAIYQVKVSPVGTAIKYWEWKGADFPFANVSDGSTHTIGNLTNTSSETLEDGDKK